MAEIESHFTAVCKRFAVLAATGVPGGELTPEVVEELVGMLVDRLKAFVRAVFGKLDEIDQKVTQLLEAKYKTGFIHLESAQTTNSSVSRLHYLQEAAVDFENASNEVEARLAPVALFYAGLCRDLLGDSAVAMKRYERAFDAAWDYERKAWEKTWLPKQRREIESYNDNFLLPLSRLLIVRSVQRNDITELKRQEAERRLCCAHLISLLQKPWDVRLPGGALSDAQKPWNLNVATKVLERPLGL